MISKLKGRDRLIRLNNEQEMVVDRAIDWFYHGTNQVFEFDGLPGTGKSITLMEIVKALNLNPMTEIAAMSFIGSASLVMRMKGLVNAKTAHSWIFNVFSEPLKDNNGKIIMDDLLNCPIMKPIFVPVDHLDPNIKLIIIDEAYSMPRSLRPIIEKFGIKILATGDKNQLPPVKDLPAFLYDPNIYHLTKCMRQMGRDDIIYIADRVNNGLPLANGYYGNSLVINNSDLTDSMLMWADAIICCKNKTRDELNKKIRQIKGYKSKLPQYGEKVVCRNNNWLEFIMDNNYTINLCNGLIGTVMNCPDISTFDGKLFSMDFKPDLVPNGIFFDSRCNYKYITSDYDDRKRIKEAKWELGNKFEFAYAITAHIAQGSQFHKVIYIEEKMYPQIQSALNLVGATRADQNLIYVKNY